MGVLPRYKPLTQGEVKMGFGCNLICSVSEVQAFVSEYFGTWQGTDIERIMRYYSDDVSLVFAGTTMAGKEAVENQFLACFSIVVTQSLEPNP
jgi:uncharacterized protein (TIGR02246 family)